MMSGPLTPFGSDDAEACADGVCVVPEVSPAQRAAAAIDASGVDYAVTEHGPVRSLDEAAAARGVEPRQIVKTLVVRRAEDDFVLVLVPGDRTIAWPKLRQALGENRLSMPDADGAFAATGYVRGTITPFGATRNWPVVADSTLDGLISIGGGDHGVAFAVDAADVIRVLGAQVADVTELA